MECAPNHSSWSLKQFSVVRERFVVWIRKSKMAVRVGPSLVTIRIKTRTSNKVAVPPRNRCSSLTCNRCQPTFKNSSWQDRWNILTGPTFWPTMGHQTPMLTVRRYRTCTMVQRDRVQEQIPTQSWRDPTPSLTFTLNLEWIQTQLARRTVNHSIGLLPMWTRSKIRHSHCHHPRTNLFLHHPNNLNYMLVQEIV